MEKTIRIKKENNIYIATISRPEALNALNKRVLEDLQELICVIQQDKLAKILILTGEGRSFVAGADIVSQSVLDIDGGTEWGRYGSKIFRDLEKLELITIAAVNGYALGGGCELAMSCDLRIASTKAKFGQPEVSLGIIPGFSGTQRLPRLVGVSKAKELILTGDIISAEEAEKIGLVNKVVLPENLMVEALNIANKIIKNGPLAVKYSKYAINKALELDIDAGIKMENKLFGMCFGTADQKEGMKAFIEKKEAKFVGK